MECISRPHWIRAKLLTSFEHQKVTDRGSVQIPQPESLRGLAMSSLSPLHTLQILLWKEAHKVY